MDKTKTVKSGYKTTEFWLHNAVSVFNWIAVLANNNTFPPSVALKVQAFTTGVYALARGIAKAG